MITPERMREIFISMVKTDAPKMLSASAMPYMQSLSKQNEASLKILRKQRNLTDKLRIMSGALVKSLIPDGEGNITRISNDGESYTIEYGQDLSIIPYARIHNLGGNAGRNLSVFLKPRPFETAETMIKTFNEKKMPDLAKKMAFKVMEEFK